MSTSSGLLTSLHAAERTVAEVPHQAALLKRSHEPEIFHCMDTSVKTRQRGAETITHLVKHFRGSNAQHDLTGRCCLPEVRLQVLAVKQERSQTGKNLRRLRQDFETFSAQPHNLHYFRIHSSSLFHRFPMSLTKARPDELAEIHNSHNPQEIEILCRNWTREGRKGCCGPFRIVVGEVSIP